MPLGIDASGIEKGKLPEESLQPCRDGREKESRNQSPHAVQAAAAQDLSDEIRVLVVMLTPGGDGPSGFSALPCPPPPEQVRF